MEIVVLDGFVENPGDLSWDEFFKLGPTRIYDRTRTDEILEKIGNAEIVFTNKTPLTKETIQACPNLKFIGILATGYDVVDVHAAAESKVIVSNVPGYGTDTVAQFTIALLLELCHHVDLHSTSVKRGDWSNCPDWSYTLTRQTELAGKIMGIIGFGSIGQRTAELAQALKMKILAYDVESSLVSQKQEVFFVDLPKLYQDSDVIVLHCPLNASTKGMINQHAIDQMKDGVWLINDARGGLVDPLALANALNTGKIGAAAVDVVPVEPIPSDSPLLAAKNIIITPHMAWTTKEARRRIMEISVRNVQAFLQGQPINVVS